MRAHFNKLDATLKEKLRDISLIALDFDGVLTNNKVIHGPDGAESVSRSKADSLGIDLLSESGLYNKREYGSFKHLLDIVILSREANPVVKSVAEKIKIKCQSSVHEKLKALQEEARSRNVDLKNVLFMGNDLNDVECLDAAGIGVAVADACPHVLRRADYVTLRKGGEGALREICELIMYAKDVHPFP